MIGKSLKSRLRRAISFSLFLLFSFTIFVSPCKSATTKKSPPDTFTLREFEELELYYLNTLGKMLKKVNDLQILISSAVNSNVYNRNFYYSLINNDNKDQEFKESSSAKIANGILDIMNNTWGYRGVDRETFFQYPFGTEILLNRDILEKEDLRRISNFLDSSYTNKICESYYATYKTLENEKKPLVKKESGKNPPDYAHYSLIIQHKHSPLYRHYCYKEYKEEIQNGIVQQNNKKSLREQLGIKHYFDDY